MQSISIYIVIGLTAWVIAQLTKYIIATLTKKKLADSSRLYLSGGMPSAHATTTVAMLTAIAIKEGVGSGLFAVMAIFTAVVIYDAVMVRRSSGEQGEAILSLIHERKSKVIKPFVAKGHTVIEVLAGSIIGFVVAVVFLSI